VFRWAGGRLQLIRIVREGSCLHSTFPGIEKSREQKAANAPGAFWTAAFCIMAPSRGAAINLVGGAQVIYTPRRATGVKTPAPDRRPGKGTPAGGRKVFSRRAETRRGYDRGHGTQPPRFRDAAASPGCKQTQVAFERGAGVGGALGACCGAFRSTPRQPNGDGLADSFLDGNGNSTTRKSTAR